VVLIKLSLARRTFLSRAALLTAGATLCRVAPVLAAEKAPELIPRHLFFVRADYASVQLSPDGTRIAYLAPANGILNVFVAPVSAPQKGRQVTRVTDRDVSFRMEWAHDNRHIVFFRDRDGDENWRASSVNVESGDVKLLTPESGVRALVQEVSHLFPTEMLLRHNARDRQYSDLYRINVVTGESQRVFENNELAWFVTDSQFRLRLGTKYRPDGSMEVFERRADGSWSPFMHLPIEDVESSRLIDFSADGNTLYMIDSRDRDKAALVAVDMASQRRTVLAHDEEADVVRVELDPRTRRPLAALAVKDRARWHAVDGDAWQDLARFRAWSRGDLYFSGRSLDSRRVVMFDERDNASGEYAMLDRAAARVVPLYRARAALDDRGLRPLQPIVIRARDGLELNSYLTLPAGRPGANERLPLVMVIHGGPYWRDSWGYSSVHQFLANRGYAVLSVNFRGSTGFGKAFISAADRQWGGRMHDDLIDALDWAVKNGIADPKRVGFYGASYGGYAALTAATKTPERFACIVDIFGISNLLTFMATIPPYWKPFFSVWKTRVGDPDTEEGRAFLRSRSPLFNLERADRPILIVQGMRDVRVVAAESEQMVAALRKNGAPVTYVTFPDEGHGFVRQENRLAFFAVVEAFLAKHLGGRYEPIGTAFAGSSIKLEAGSDLVPGLSGARTVQPGG
jgi:dipeptidyl aminopeptidase/acylaminoacyl peptidase